MEFSDLLQKLIIEGKFSLLYLEERINLTYRAFDVFIKKVDDNPEENININLAIGMDGDTGELIERTRSYCKNDLVQVINNRCISQVPIDGIIRLTTIMEAIFSDILLRVIYQYPEKIGSQNKIDLSVILKSQSIEELKEYAYNKFVNDLSYKGTEDYSKEFNKITSVDLLNCSEFPKYIEVKTSRDLHIHNSGVINETYIRKVGDYKRGNIGDYLDVDIKYFYQSYEVCFRILEFMERELHKKWPSTLLENIYKNAIEKYGLNKAAP